MRKKKSFIIPILVIIATVLAIGYAYLTTTLSINGITDIDRNSWDVYFDNVQVTDGSVSGAQEIEAPTITSDTEVEFHVNLKKPGDFYEFTIEARNDGTIDAMIGLYDKRLDGSSIDSLPPYLGYMITYEDGTDIEENHLLAHESLETYRVLVEFKDDILPRNLPTTAQSLELSFEVNYIQATDIAVERNTIYNYSTTYFTIGENVPTGVTTYDNYQDAISAFDHPFFLKHYISKNKITNSLVGFVLDGKTYYIQSGNSVQNFDKNIRVLKKAFGKANCYFKNGDTYECQKPDSNYIGFARKNGEVGFTNEDYMCFINNQGKGSCYYCTY